MKTEKLLEGLEIIDCKTKVEEIFGFTNDSRKVENGYLYVSLKGKLDGDDYIDDARKRGAVLVLGESDNADIKVQDSRRALSRIAANFYGNPQKSMRIVGVVGTNGKTTTSYLMYKLSRKLGVSSGLIGTEGAYINDELIEHSLTTPDPSDFFRILKMMEQRGVVNVFCEVSAHAIFYDKLEAIKHKVLVFTNITEDHLDFFKNMECYSQTKIGYFEPQYTEMAVVNGDDPYGRRIIDSNVIPTISYGMNSPTDVFAIDVITNKLTTFTVNVTDSVEVVETKLVGMFNVYNVMAALAAMCCLGYKLKNLVSCLKEIPAPSGRYETLSTPRGRVIIDYAHTPDALQNILADISKTCHGRIITVFGCGGNRDRAKRPIMGEIAGRYSDVIVLTSDNSRYENPSQIISEIKRGVKKGKIYVEEERDKAIKFALSISRPKDTVLIAGKGAENYLDVLGVKTPYSDIITVKNIIEVK